MNTPSRWQYASSNQRSNQYTAKYVFGTFLLRHRLVEKDELRNLDSIWKPRPYDLWEILPEQPLLTVRIVHHLALRVDDHGRALTESVGGPHRIVVRAIRFRIVQ